jgi:hypothetical protein
MSLPLNVALPLIASVAGKEGEKNITDLSRSYHVYAGAVGAVPCACPFVFETLLASHLKTMYTFSIKEVLAFSKSYIGHDLLNSVLS